MSHQQIHSRYSIVWKDLEISWDMVQFAGDIRRLMSPESWARVSTGRPLDVFALRAEIGDHVWTLLSQKFNLQEAMFLNDRMHFENFVRDQIYRRFMAHPYFQSAFASSSPDVFWGTITCVFFACNSAYA